MKDWIILLALLFIFSISIPSSNTTLSIPPPILEQETTAQSNLTRHMIYDFSFRTTVDHDDNLIIVGSINGQHPRTDGYITKMSPSGEILWTYYFLPEHNDSYNIAYAVVVNSKNEIYVGFDARGSGGLPVSDKLEFGSDYNGGSTDIYLAKLSSDGNLIWGTYLGGNETDTIGKMYVDSNDTILLVGNTNSSDYPTVSPLQAQLYGGPGDRDNVFTQISSEDIIVFSTYYGGSQPDDRIGAIYDEQDNIMIVGSTISPDLPTVNSYDSSPNGDEDFYIAKLNDKKEIIWSTYFGGSGEDEIKDVQIDDQGGIWMTGFVAASSFPSNDSMNGNNEIPIIKFSKDGDLEISRIIGGSTDETGKSLQIGNNHVYLTGATNSIDFPVSNTAYQPTGARAQLLDGFVMSLDFSGDIVWSTYLGGSHQDDSRSIAVDSQSNLYVTGITLSEDFPIYNVKSKFSYGGFDTFVTKFTSSGNLLWSTRTAVVTEAGHDIDSDGLTNIEEWEYFLDPLSNDTDGDGLPDGWEVSYGLNALDPDDASDDPDGDGLSSLDEYLENPLLDPTRSDTDNDGMPDGWEVLNHLDPIKDDFNDDLDGDGLSNGFEYHFRNLGFSPNSRQDGIIFFLIIGLFLLSIISASIVVVTLHKRAKHFGFSGIREYRQITSRGFHNKSQFDQSSERGFYVFELVQLATEKELQTADQLHEHFIQFIKTSREIVEKSRLDKILQDINTTSSTVQLAEAIQEAEQIRTPLEEIHIQVSEDLTLISKVLNKYSINPWSRSRQDLVMIRDNLKDMQRSIPDLLSPLSEAIAKRRKYFEPWGSLLQFVQITEEGYPVELARISEITGYEEDHIEEILLLLLEENRWIGKYDPATKEYTKGMNIDEHIEEIIQVFSAYIDNS